MSAPVRKAVTPKIDIDIAWKRFVALSKPMDSAKQTKIQAYSLFSFVTWPALAAFGHYTMKLDYPEHAARHELVDKTMPYMNNPQNIIFKWGSPCTLLDFECSYNHRKNEGLDAVKFPQRQ
eukprot:UN02108